MLRAPVTSAHAGTLLSVFAAATALTIAVTRWALELSGYPSIGGSVYHLAHALWGGLLLTVACALLLSVRGRWVEPTGAVLGGVGTGLFVDEVGKFITRDNDYFFPLAAPIAYLCLVALAVAAYGAGRSPRRTARSHLQAGLDLVRDAIDGPVPEGRLQAVRRHARAAIELATNPDEASMGESLIAIADTRDDDSALAVPPWWSATYARLTAWSDRLFPVPRFRRVLRVVLGFVATTNILGGLIALPVSVLIALDPGMGDFTFTRTTRSPGPIGYTLYAVSAAAAVVAGVLYALAAHALRPARVDVARMWRRGSIGVITSMGVVNTAGVYIDQFSSVTALLTYGLLLGAMASFVARAGEPVE